MNTPILKTKILGLLLALSSAIYGQDFASWTEKELILSNGLFTRKIGIDNAAGNLKVISIKLPADTNNMIISGSGEFSFLLNDVKISGLSKWEKISVARSIEPFSGNGAKVTLLGTIAGNYKIQVDVTYILYPELPVLRKKIEIKNLGKEPVKVESVDMERIEVPFDITHTWILKNYCRNKHFGPYKGNWDDPALAVHELRTERGIILGNEAMGVLKRSSALLDGSTLTVGLNYTDEDFPFRKWLAVNESWVSPYAFTIMYVKTMDPMTVINTILPDFLRKHLGARTFANKEKPVFMFNTWYPTFGNLDEKSVNDWIEIAAECGFREFVLDAGWSGDPTKNLTWTSQLGDWTIDTRKFPNGLKPIFDKIKASGMVPGMWFSIGSASHGTSVLKNHPEWFVRDKDGNMTNLHNPNDKDIYTACLATGWYDYMKTTILKFVKEYGLMYLKLDLSVVTSAYVYDNSKTGCYAKNHGHKDREESYWMIYERVKLLFDELHAAVPGLYIDCTFETAGKLQLIDYDVIKHAEGDWISNFEEAQPLGAMRVRNLAFNRSPVIPASSLIIGNMPLDDRDYNQIIRSLIGSMPIFLGDLRKIKKEDRKAIKQWADWIAAKQDCTDFMSYRQDLPGFGEPAEGKWDGYLRLNTETKSSAILGIFKQGGIELRRTLCIPGLQPDKIFEIREAPYGKTVLSLTGKELAEKGFEVELLKVYDSVVFEIVLAN